MFVSPALYLGGSMVLSGISCFFLWFGTSESMMIGMLCLYNGLTISAWNSLDVITVELYPTDRRYVQLHLHKLTMQQKWQIEIILYGPY